MWGSVACPYTKVKGHSEIPSFTGAPTYNAKPLLPNVKLLASINGSQETYSLLAASVDSGQFPVYSGVVLLDDRIGRSV
jgi:hypothetical protein